MGSKVRPMYVSFRVLVDLDLGVKKKRKVLAYASLLIMYSLRRNIFSISRAF